jgi:hypothetical protein
VMRLRGQDGDLGPPHLDLPNVGGDELSGVDGRIVSDGPADRIENDGFDLCRGHGGPDPAESGAKTPHQMLLINWLAKVTNDSIHQSARPDVFIGVSTGQCQAR